MATASSVFLFFLSAPFTLFVEPNRFRVQHLIESCETIKEEIFIDNENLALQGDEWNVRDAPEVLVTKDT